MSSPSSKRFPCLDGLRGISVALVLAGHTSLTVPDRPHGLKPIIKVIFGYPGLGVLTFFVLSGFLITSLLVREAQAGKVDLPRFYARRALRIWPVFYAYIAVLAGLTAMGFLNINVDQLLSAASFTWNYKHLWATSNKMGDWLLGHFWTLALEQQYYFLWPLVLVLLGRIRGRQACFVILALLPAIRVATYFLFPGSRGQIGIMLHTAPDGLLLGSLIALSRDRPEYRQWVERIRSALWPLAALVFLFIISPIFARSFRGMYLLPVGFTAQAVAVGLILVWLLENPGSWGGRLLNTRPLMALGWWSYSLYVWQQPFISPDNKTWSGKFPVNLVIVFVLGLASYYGIEKPLQSLRGRLRSRTPALVPAVVGIVPPEPTTTDGSP